MPLTIPIALFLNDPHEWIHNKPLFCGVVLLALVQGIGTVIGGDLTIISLPSRYRRLYRKVHKRRCYALALCLVALTISLGIFNDRILMGADADNVHLQNKIGVVQTGVAKLVALQNDMTNVWVSFLRNRGIRPTTSEETRKAQDRLTELQNKFDEVAQNLSNLISKRTPLNTSPAAVPPSASSESVPANTDKLDPQCPNPDSPWLNLKPYAKMTIPELRTELRNCARDLSNIKFKTSDLRASNIHSVYNFNPDPSPEQFAALAAQDENLDEVDRESYLSLRPQIVRLRKEVLARLEISPSDSRDGFASFDKEASTPRPKAKVPFDLNTSPIFDSVGGYLMSLDDKLSKLPQQ